MSDNPDENSLTIDLFPHQVKFLKSNTRFLALAGGFGCGKSFALGAKAYALAAVNHGFQGALVSRTSKQLYDFLIPEVETFFNAVHCKFKYRDGNKMIIDWGADESVIHLLTTENESYKRWAGGNWAWACIDEIDTMAKAAEVWKYVNDRIRVEAPLLQTACASTPEGYGFLWNFFENEPKKGLDPDGERELIRGCTFDNNRLNRAYVKSQIATRDPSTLKAYIYGEFVNLEGIVVYYRYNKDLNNTDKTLGDFPNAICHIGVDFNKGINAANVSVVQNGMTYTVMEFNESHDIDHLIAQIRQKLPGRAVAFYPDASNFEGIRQLERAFGDDAVHYHPANPAVEKRVHAVNSRFATDTGMPLAFINQELCPQLHIGMVRQTRGPDGKPDKTKGIDHQLDGYGYFTNWHWPTDGRQGSVKVVAGAEEGKYQNWRLS